MVKQGNATDPKHDKNIQLIQGHVPPHNIEAEKAVLGSVMLHNKVLSQVVTLLQPSDFYQDKHRWIYEVLRDLESENEPLDILSVSDKLQTRGLLDKVGGLPYLSELADKIPTVVNTTYYAKIIKEKSIVRQIITAGTEIVTEAYEEVEDVAAFLDSAERRIFEIRQERDQRDLAPASEIVKSTFKAIQGLYNKKELITGVPTGFDEFDKMTSGLQPSDLIILAGRPSMGKCLTSDTLILQEDGSLASIESLYKQKQARVLTLNDHWEFDWCSPSAFVDDGLKDVYQVTTQLGKTVESTLPHPFLTPQGWRSLAELTVGTKIAVPQIIDISGKETPPDEQIIETSRLLSQSSLKIPAYIFKMTKEKLSFFLYHLYLELEKAKKIEETNQRQKDDSSYLIFRLSNETFAKQFQHLLLRFGVLCSMIQDEKKSRWLLEIEEVISSIHFMNEIIMPNADPEITSDFSIPKSPSISESYHGDIYWDKIKEIRHLGKKQVYDLTIPESHNFVANDICVHNTSLALNMASNAALIHKTSVALFSLEMSKEQLMVRLLCSTARVEAGRLRTGQMKTKDIPKLTDAASQLGKTSLYIDDGGNTSVLEIRAKCRRLKMEIGNLGLIIIDYLQLMSGDKGEKSREQEISNISRGLKSLAKELKVPVLALSQLNRSLEKRPDKRPLMSDLRESGAIEQDADVILFVYRDEVYNSDTDDKGIAELIIGKQRNGPIGSVRLRFFNEYTRFDNLYQDEQ